MTVQSDVSVVAASASDRRWRSTLLERGKMRSNRFLGILAVSFAICGVLSAPASAQYVQQTKLTTVFRPEPEQQFGWSVALSRIGNWAVVGDPRGAQNVVFARNGAMWKADVGFHFGSKFLPGWSVALSDPPSPGFVLQLLLGSPGPDTPAGRGEAQQWLRAPGIGQSWLPLENLRPNGQAASAAFGTSVSLSKDGKTAIFGGPGENNGTGAAWIFQENALVLQERAKLVGTGAGGEAKQGSAVAISGDGNTALIGGPADTTGAAGAVWVFTKQGRSWIQQGTKLFGTGAVGDARQGAAVALSFDGTTALVGGPADNNGIGAFWVWTRDGDGTWSQQGKKLVGGENLGAAQQGTSVALSDDGNTAVIGGPGDDGNAGAVWVFTRSGGQWSQLGNEPLTASNASSKAQQGFSVALSRDGNYLIFGGPGNTGGGAAWIFTRFTGIPRASDCYGSSVATLNATYSNNLDNAATALGFPQAEALVADVRTYCR